MTSLKRNRSAKVSKRPSGLPKLSVKPPQVAPAPARAVQRSLHEVSPKCHRGRENHRDGKIWDSNRGCCLNLWWATEEEDGCHGKSLCALA